MKKTILFIKTKQRPFLSKMLALWILLLCGNPPFMAAHSNPIYEQTITGTVRDVNNEGIPGVSVVLEGTSKGAITDMKGSYQISVSGANDVLIFSSVGMETEKMWTPMHPPPSIPMAY